MTDQNPRKQNAQKNVPKHRWGSARTAANSIVLATLLAGTANADPQSRVVELFDSVQGVRGQGPINDKGEAEAKAFFETEMHPLVYPTCYLSCHQAGGVSGGSDLVLVGPGPNQIAANNSAFVNFITVFSSSATLLTRISGGGHPGRAIYTNGSSQYQVIETWTQFYD
ncbi:MAG: hypothetical protein O2981_08545 [Proteobacteria bacterium]|nr:hypothetical protein [Pseudomonadota bacterium]